MARRIAQALVALVEEECRVRANPDPALQARRELRALLAVARAWDKMAARGVPSWPEAEAMVKTRARLDRASGDGR